MLKLMKDGDFVMEEMDMREEYDIKALNPRKNPYTKKIKKPVTMHITEIFIRKEGASGSPSDTPPHGGFKCDHHSES